MEAVIGEQPNDFPQQITPFPESLDLTTALHSATNVPPQKLRPIRRSPAEDPPSFLAEHICAVTGESSAYFEGAVDMARKVGSGSIEESFGLNSDWCSLDDEDEGDSSSSSDDDGDDGDNLLNNIKEPGKLKRKRKMRKKIESFLENLVMRMMEKQEQMHKQLIETVEKRERERIIREEAWKQQEMERFKRDEQIRAQEMSRSIALISFIQNVLGHEIQIPQMIPVSFTEENGAKNDGNLTENDVMCNPNNRRWPEACDPNRRWPEAEVQALIMLRTASEHKFRGLGSKCSIWDEISVGMQKMGYDRSAKKCKEKWENINKYFRKSTGNGKKHLENSKTRPYFHDLDILYRNGLVNPGNASNFTNYDDVAKSEKE